MGDFPVPPSSKLLIYQFFCRPLPGTSTIGKNMQLHQSLTATWSLRPGFAPGRTIRGLASSPLCLTIRRQTGARRPQRLPRLLRERQVALKLRGERCHQSVDAAAPTFEKSSPLLTSVSSPTFATKSARSGEVPERLTVSPQSRSAAFRCAKLTPLGEAHTSRTNKKWSRASKQTGRNTNDYEA